MYFDSMINGLYKDAADNLKFTDPAKGEEGGYTKIFEPEKDVRIKKTNRRSNARNIKFV